MIDFNDATPQVRAFDPIEWEQRLERLRTALRQRAREVVGEVFPQARIHGSDARIGSVQGEPGESLSIGLDGERAGLWTDHATGEGGDLITLWQATIGSTDFAAAVPELEDWLGIGQRPRFATRVARVASERQAQAKVKPRENTPLPAPSASWHYLAADGVTVLAVVRRYDLDTIDPVTGKPKKTFRPYKPDSSAGMPDPRPLYGLPALATASEVVLVEGEKCVDALATVGVVATTQMGGAKADPAKTDWSPLAGKSVAVWQDNDAAGEGLTERVSASLTAIGCTIRTIRPPSGKPPSWDAADAVDEGLDIAVLLQPPPGAQRRKMRLLTLDQLAALKPPEWLIDGHLPAASFASLYGPHGSLKSFVALDWGLCVAHGRPWLGLHAVKPGRVVYVAGEGQHGFAKRVLGWRSAKSEQGDSASLPFHVLPQSVAMPTNELDEMIGLVAELPTPPTLIILDTLARTFGQGDENSQKDMNAFVAACDRLRDVTGACVLVIHHSGKDAERGTRGSTALPGAVDTNVFVRRKGDEVTLVNSAPHGKQKDAAEFADVCLRSQVVKFSYQGEVATTLVLTPDEGEQIASETVKPEPARRLGPNQIRIMDALEQAARGGQRLGFTRLQMMTQIDKGTLGSALRTLVEQGRIVETPEPGRVWLLP